ncbi:ABC transporter ATP-binding protein [Paenibacillus lentus]|uniref:ABC transporter ATP-binding protein n=1 Tax=Paenibacillus lentus TaxID=1338368 RepID=UPI0013DDDF5E|nr:ABC transporter ATP-binding protein [Paenibacillus lentus]
MNNDIVILKGIGKQYSAHGLAIDNINLSVKSGEMVAIIGESGSGKTTLLNIIGGNIKEYLGHYKFQGKDFNSLSKREIAEKKNKCIGYIIQDYGLIDDLSVYNNVKLPLLFNQDIKINQIKGLVMSVLEKVNLSKFTDRKVRQLSGGEKQRVAIARAIINRPTLVIADEPTAALDTSNTFKVMELLKKINVEEGVTFIIATHNKKVAEMCNRTIMLQDGKIVN